MGRVVLEQNLSQSVEDLRLENSFTFQQIGEPQHTGSYSGIVYSMFERHRRESISESGSKCDVAVYKHFRMWA